MTTSCDKLTCEVFKPSEYWRNKARTAGIPPIPAAGVVGEIKPHNSKGISAGVEQLRKSRGTPKRLLLLTYRTVDKTNPSRYEVLMADPGELKAVIDERDQPKPKGKRHPPVLTRLTTWYKIGQPIEESCALGPIPYHTCPVLLGNQLEKRVRCTYQTFMQTQHRSGFTLRSKKPSAPGHDILHEELADFLAELALQLHAA